MRFAVVGTGGVGGYFGGRLAQAGLDVTFVARGNHLAAIQKSGLRVDSICGDLWLENVIATAQLTDAVDVILLAVKGWQLPEAVRQMKPAVGPDTMILPLLNGMDHMDVLIDQFGSEHVLGGLCRISAFIEAPGYIRHVGIDPFLAFGEMNKEKSARVMELFRVIKDVPGCTIQVPEDISLAMWEKYLLISAFSGVGAVTRMPVGVFRAIPQTRAMFRRALEEVVLVANSRGVALSQQSVQSVMDRIDQTQPDTMASMQKDILAGRPSELETQTGALVRMANAAGLSVPLHEFIYASLLPQEQQARSA